MRNSQIARRVGHEVVSSEFVPADSRQTRQFARQRAITEAVMVAGTMRIERLADQFEISLMTVHRDLDELQSRGLLRKSRGLATATATNLVESSDVYRANRELEEKEALARAAIEFIEPGQAVILDDSTTVHQIAKHLHTRTPLTIITNALTLMNEVNGQRGVSLLALGGQYHNWCNAFMGWMTTQAISNMRADIFIMSTPAITDDIAFHQTLETVHTKRAMFDAARTRILLADHTKFDKSALHALVPLSDFDTVIVDDKTPDERITRMQSQGVHVIVASDQRNSVASEQERAT